MNRLLILVIALMTTLFSLIDVVIDTAR